MYKSNAYSAYKNNSVNYASKEQLLLMLCDGAVKYAKMGRQAIADKDVMKAHESLVRTQDIITELMITLDTSAGEWAEQLFAVYDFIKQGLAEGNMKKDVQKLDEVIPLIEDIRDMWYEAERLSKCSK